MGGERERERERESRNKPPLLETSTAGAGLAAARREGHRKSNKDEGREADGESEIEE